MEFVDLLKSVEKTVNGGKAVVSADNSIVVSMMQEALRQGRSATFYVSPAQGQAMMRWYWTARRVKEIGYDLVSKDERARIESELGIKCKGTWYSNRIECPNCGSLYGMFEFMQQGLREHDRDWIKAVLKLENTTVLRINSAFDTICANCKIIIVITHNYGMYFDNGTLIYGCCSGVI